VHFQASREDPTLAWEQHGDTQKLSFGVKEIHLQVADRLRRKYNLPMTTAVAYKETIRKPVPQSTDATSIKAVDTDSLGCLSRNQATTTWEGFNSAKGLSVAWYEAVYSWR